MIRKGLNPGNERNCQDQKSEMVGAGHSTRLRWSSRVQEKKNKINDLFRGIWGKGKVVSEVISKWLRTTDGIRKHHT